MTRFGREFGAKIGLCFGPKAPGRKNEEVAPIKAARELGGNSSAHSGTHGGLPQRTRALFFEELPISWGGSSEGGGGVLCVCSVLAFLAA